MEVLLIKNEQDLIFKSKSSSIVRKHKNKQLNNSLTFNSAESDIVSNPKLSNFINLYFDLSSRSNYLTSTSDQINLEKLTFSKFSSILNLKKVNDIRFINKFFETVNTILPSSGLYLGKVVTYPNRRSAILKKYPPVLNKIIYFFDYIFSRVLPKLPIAKNLYFQLTKGKGRVISRAEVYGRLYSCGFEIIDEKTINHSLFFVAKKFKDPCYDQNPTYAPLISLNRIGKNGKIIKVHKLRTMHPFSEYLQEYVYNRNKLQEGGKIKNDFRISPEGRFFRKFWIDEIPMLINIFKGEMKLVGVRPLTKHFYSLYDEDLQQKRIKNKPGFIPPFYVDLPKTMSEIMESERKYLELYDQSPFITDVKYFFMAFKNVLFKGARSK
jgi:lipopolysaccharide/colanic/teichoic acid biosynthesis glycosyltransferase/ribosomal protein L33